MGRRNKRKQKTRKKRNRGNRQYTNLEWHTEFFKLKQQLKNFGLRIKEISGDGNCLFKAVSDQLIGSEDLHKEYRELACNYMQAHKEYFSPFVEDDWDFDDYVMKMRKEGTWGGNMELQALSLCLEVNIKIHMFGRPLWEISNFAQDRGCIHLSYHDGDHYNSVRLMTDTHQEPAQPIPDELEFTGTEEEELWSDGVEYLITVTEVKDKRLLKLALQTNFLKIPTISMIEKNLPSIVQDVERIRNSHYTKHGETKESYIRTYIINPLINSLKWVTGSHETEELRISTLQI
mmetsp:Transcript_511/g.861  ORF Transcript_511/g.861 Transcript_511/m.861 type:complete len:290 (-) Transcript_511:2754-3623(-)